MNGSKTPCGVAFCYGFLLTTTYPIIKIIYKVNVDEYQKVKKEICDFHLSFECILGGLLFILFTQTSHLNKHRCTLKIQ